MDAIAIEARGIEKRYGDVTAVAGINLSVRRGELFGLVGADGAGKTTTIRMLCTLSRPSGGEARVLGLDIIKDAERIKSRVGYVSERFSLYPTLTVAENLDFFARLRGVPTGLAAERKEELLDFSRLEPFRDRPSEQLSGGMQKKLSLCCTLIHQPEVIFLDEPTSGVDPLSRRDFWVIIGRFAARGVTFLVSTPYMDEAERFSRVAFIHQGKVLACDTPEQLKAGLSGDLLEVSAHLARRAASVLRAMPGAASAQVFGGSIHLLVDSAEKRLPELGPRLTGQGVTLNSAHAIAPGLEDVFVRLLTGAGGQEVPPVREPDTRPAAGRSQGTGNAIEVFELTRKFNNFLAVDRVSFAVRPGEVFAFLGPNGSGKTTTIRMLCGILRPSSGRATVLGQDMALSPHRVRQEFGYMSQRFSLYPDLTVAQNIDFYGGLYGLSGPRLAERKSWVLEMAGLVGREKALASALSGGWRQRLALGCALIHRPRVIFLDEPTAGVDPLSRRFFWELIEELAEQGNAILVTTHYMDEAEHCHRLGLMHQGRLIAKGSPAELKSGPGLGSLIEVSCSDSSRAVDLLLKQPAYRRVGLFGSTLHLAVDDAAVDLVPIKRLLEDTGITVHSVNHIPFTLEDVFVSLVERQDTRTLSSAAKGA